MSAGYVIKEGFAGFKRARLAAFTSVTAMMVAILLIGILTRLAFNAYDVAHSLKNSIDIEVFLNDMNQKQTQAIGEQLKKISIVSRVIYISKDSAAAVFRKQFGSEGASLAKLNFLPASFKLYLNDDVPVKTIQDAITKIKKMDGIDEVSFNQHLLEILQARIQTLIIAGAGLGLIIILASMLLVFNTIRLTIYAKRGLIKAMKLVGATNGFIRRPFLVEGLIQSIIAAAIASGLIWLFFQYIVPNYIPQFGILSWPYGQWYYLVGAMFVLAMLMGYFGSRGAAHKFIKETTIS